MAFYLTQRTWARFIIICRDIWEPLLFGSVKANLSADPVCRGWCLSHVWGQAPSLGCGCAVGRHSCPGCSSQPTSCPLGPAALPGSAKACHCAPSPADRAKLTSPGHFAEHSHCSLCWREGTHPSGTKDRWCTSLLGLSPESQPDGAVCGREVLHARFPLLQEEWPCFGRLPRTTPV